MGNKTKKDRHEKPSRGEWEGGEPRKRGQTRVTLTPYGRKGGEKGQKTTGLGGPSLLKKVEEHTFVGWCLCSVKGGGGGGVFDVLLATTGGGSPPSKTKGAGWETGRRLQGRFSALGKPCNEPKGLTTKKAKTSAKRVARTQKRGTDRKHGKGGARKP